MTAKDFRTWHATVLAAVTLAGPQAAAARSPSARKRAISRTMREVAQYLGNTPTVARASYVDPRVLDLYHAGATVAPDLAAATGAADAGGGADPKEGADSAAAGVTASAEDAAVRDVAERAVLGLLTER